MSYICAIFQYLHYAALRYVTLRYTFFFDGKTYPPDSLSETGVIKYFFTYKNKKIKQQGGEQTLKNRPDHIAKKDQPSPHCYSIYIIIYIFILDNAYKDKKKPSFLPFSPFFRRFPLPVFFSLPMVPFLLKTGFLSMDYILYFSTNSYLVEFRGAKNREKKV